MAVTPNDILHKKNLNKRVDVTDIDLDNVSIEDLKYNGDNY